MLLPEAVCEERQEARKDLARKGLSGKCGWPRGWGDRSWLLGGRVGDSSERENVGSAYAGGSYFQLSLLFSAFLGAPFPSLY